MVTGEMERLGAQGLDQLLLPSAGNPEVFGHSIVISEKKPTISFLSWMKSDRKY